MKYWYPMVCEKSQMNNLGFVEQLMESKWLIVPQKVLVKIKVYEKQIAWNNNMENWLFVDKGGIAWTTWYRLKQINCYSRYCNWKLN